MEETVDKYSSQSVVEIRLDPNKCSYDTTASTIRLRDRLQSLMGSDVIRLNDRKYTQQLRRKLDEEYEAKMRKKEETLAKAEKERVRKLMLEGIIPMNSKDDDPLMPNHRPRRKHRSRQKRSESPIRTQVEVEPQTPKRSPTPRSTPTVRSNANQQSQQNDGENEEADRASSQKSHVKTDADSRNDRLSDNDSLNSGGSSSSSRKRISRSSTKENPLVQTLRQEETVAGLYNIAARLVAPPV
ncbi:hypothetical protein FSP39_006026 [Pinctada imbricata]|uniref:Uncharacterized protein n=1 Tax=Pinctada imbricata TaxID=66713 RepID=A0AA89BYK6_PINIB|nr:hypothetical protein FSP39_006026 [Pinctada imbricata]